MPSVIANSSPLQYLHRLGMLDLLQSYYGTVLVPEAVVREFGSGAVQGSNVPVLTAYSWIQVERVPPGFLPQVSPSIGPGEREVLALALSKPDPLAILDDAEARRQALRLSIRFTGLLGVLLRAKHEGLLGNLGLMLDELRKHGFYLDARTRLHVLLLAGETP